MTTSGNTSWEVTRTQIIDGALRKLGVLPEGGTANANQISTAAQALNGIVTLFQTKGMPLWKRTNDTVPLVLGQSVYTITDAVKIPQVVLQYINQTTQYELIQKSEYDFNRLPAGIAVPSLPVHYYFQPGISNGTLTIWPAPDAGSVANNRLLVVKQKKFDGFFNATDTPDFPSYYSLGLIYSLAVLLAPEFGIPTQDYSVLKREAAEYTEQAFSYGDEDGSLYFQPDRHWGRY